MQAAATKEEGRPVEPRRRGTGTATQGAVAGATAGIISRFVAAPFDLVKIRFQVQLEPISRGAQGQRGKYVSLWQSVRSICAEEGWRGFWRGNVPATALWVTYTAVQFACYRKLQEQWSEEVTAQHVALVGAINGACAGMVATATTYPLDLFRTIFASQGVPKQFPTLASLARHRWQVYGLRGFYAGQAATLFQIAPYAGLNFAVYTSLNSVSKDARGKPRLGMLSYASNGAIAGLVSKLAVYPMDTVKKRMQMRGVSRSASYGSIPQYESSWQCFRTILCNEGLAGLYKGVTPSLLKSVVGHSATFATYELTVVLLEYRRA